MSVEVDYDVDRTARRIVLTGLFIGLLLVVLDATVNYARLSPYGSLRRLTNVAREDGFNTWLSSVQLAMVGVVLFCIRLRARQLGTTPRVILLGWGLLAAFFVYMGIDDGAAIHERVGTAVKQAMAGSGDAPHAPSLFDAFPTYTWQLVFAPFFGGGALLLLWFLKNELKPRRAQLGVALGLACFVTAVGLDFVEGVDGLHDSMAVTLGISQRAMSHFSKVLEEFLEFFGTTLFLAGFTAHLLTSLSGLDLSFRSREKGAPR